MTLPAHLQALIALRKARVDYILVGALALDHYVPDMASVYLTADCDILLRPTVKNVARAYKTLIRSGYSLSANGEPVMAPDALETRRILERRLTLRAEKPASLPIDLMTDAIGFAFGKWWAGRVSFTAGGAKLPCAAPEMVVESKRQAGRDKDRLLLRLYEARFPRTRAKRGPDKHR